MLLSILFNRFSLFKLGVSTAYPIWCLLNDKCDEVSKQTEFRFIVPKFLLSIFHCLFSFFAKNLSWFSRYLNKRFPKTRFLQGSVHTQLSGIQMRSYGIITIAFLATFSLHISAAFLFGSATTSFETRLNIL